MKTSKTAIEFKFDRNTVTVLGKPFPATYAMKYGNVYVTASITVNDTAIPLRIRFTEDMGDMFTAAHDAATAFAEQPSATAPEPAQVEQPSVETAPVEEHPTETAPEPAQVEQPVTAPVEEHPTETAPETAQVEPSVTAPVEEHPTETAPEPAQVEQPVTAPVEEHPTETAPEPAQVEQPVTAPVEEHPTETAPETAQVEQPSVETAPVKPSSKSYIGTTITGNGWKIVFDDEAKRTRVWFDAKPTTAQEAATSAAGFYKSASGSWNRRLTLKAHRAALDLAKVLAKIA